MCTGVEIAAIGGAVLQGVGKITGGSAQKKQAYAEGDAQFSEALQHAKKIRTEAREIRSAARAGFASSGVVVDEGTTARIDADITQRSEEDALNTILTGQHRRAELRKSGKAAYTGALFGAGGSALSAYGGGGWAK